jgi:hypothetical protein
MSTKKDELYKQRQVEFRKLNKHSYSEQRGNWKHDSPIILTIEHKDKYYGLKGR